jgi:DNA-binding NarL/FixJ family response regulator
MVVAGGGPDESDAVRTTPTIRILISHPELLARASLRALLEQHADISVTGEAADGQQAVALACSDRPDVVLIDIRLSGLDPLEATRQILAGAPEGGTRIRVIGPEESEGQLLGVLRAGASGLLAGDIDPAELVRGVRVVARGEALLSPGATRRLIEEFAAVPDPQRGTPAELEELTARERAKLVPVAYESGLVQPSRARVAAATTLAPAPPTAAA